jgi:hypothetical protein
MSKRFRVGIFSSAEAALVASVVQETFTAHYSELSPNFGDGLKDQAAA